MDPPKKDVPKLPDMVMCGDHPSFTKTELNIKLEKEEKPWDKPKTPMSYTRISPSSSRTERPERPEHLERPPRPELEARRCGRGREPPPRPDADHAANNTALVQALGSFRWPPYLVCVWVVVLAATHALHCLVSLLERALPTVRKLCQYFRTWTEESWKLEQDTSHRVFPLALACLTGLMYTVYYFMYMLYSIALWSIEPLCSELEETKTALDVMETKVTNYIEEVNSKANLKA